MTIRQILESIDFKVGDKVKTKPIKKGRRSPLGREGVVVSITNDKDYPIKVKFEDGSFGTYKASGAKEDNSRQVLFLDK